ncbi:DUF2509 family protein [Proteus mirabilis]|uniref:DUF2509 family protein n=1 Tax=Proteus mirabilis TaxID=584 RepID=UPI001A245CC3|nr:DUF2509 family protein [Proteus mirabilis]MBI6390836.1 YgdB family protein [Proteus mirabilis]WJI11672.1 YgdB family protein [Proteus mirabilis]HCU0912598.1 YgdB family protein [Proteus mirabilis]
MITTQGIIKEQQGVIGLMAAVGFMVISLSLLTSFAYHYRQCQLMVMQELQAKQTFLFAGSALSWGMTLTWDLSPSRLYQWQCRTFTAEPNMKSCFSLRGKTGALLLGEAKSHSGDKISHYQWINLVGKEKLHIEAQHNGWLDYCPLVKEGCI